MDFYEELGVTRSASPDEIRHAWKRLARLFHPDVQGDPEVRSAAELQMRRLNHVVDVLTDPRRRMQYDLSLRTFIPPFPFAPPPPTPERPDLRQLFRFDGKAAVWLLAGALTAGGVALLLHRDEPEIPSDAAIVETGSPAVSSTAVSSTKAVPAPDKADTGSPVQPSPATRPADTEIARSSPPQETAPPRADSPPPQALPTAAPAPLPAEGEHKAASEPATAPRVEPHTAPAATSKTAHAALIHARPLAAALRPAAVSNRDRTQAKGLSGLWRLRTAPRSIPAGAFAAERVEVFIRERSGQIYGTYHGKYSVPQQVASPTVAFQFSGAMDSRATKMPWTSADGNSGEISLHPLSKNSLEVVWVATHIAKHGILASGRAILARTN